MKITYLNHSGFLLEWSKCYWLFDYYKGEIPVLDAEKDIFVFCSHSHHDHFNPEIFQLLKDYPKVTYVFADEMKEACDKLEVPEIHFLQDHTSINFNELVETAFNNFYLFESEELIRELSKFEDVYCYHDDDVNSFDTFYVKSKLVESATGTYTYPESICVPTNIKGSSAFYLSHELCHMLKERNSKECEIRNAYSEVIPMLMEFIFSSMEAWR